MANSYVQVPQDSNGKKIDTSEITVGSNIVERQRIVISDSTNSNGVSNVINTQPSSTDYGIVTRVVPNTVSTSSVISVAASTSSVTLLTSNSNRKSATIYNDSTGTLYLKLGAVASNTSFTIKMAAYSYFELPLPCYTGVIDGIWTNTNGAASVTEFF